MRIAISVRPLETGHSNRGVGVYTKNLISALHAYEKEHSYLLFSGSDIPRNIDVVHYPYFDPFFLTLPIIKKKPIIVTVHDLIPIVFPNKFSAGVRGFIKWQINKISIRQCRRIITDSIASKKDIETFTMYPEDQIDVVYLAPSATFSADCDKSCIERVKQKYKLSKRYIIYVGDVNWNKNIIGIIQAFYESNIYKQSDLILVGSAFKKRYLPEVKQILQYINKVRISSQMHIVGYIPDDDLSVLYSNAIACLLPSFYEGFGLPILEALACKCPVITSNLASMKEIAGPSILVDPYKTETIQKAMKSIFSMSNAERKSIIQKGSAWVDTFTWRKTASATVRSYEKAINNRSGL